MPDSYKLCLDVVELIGLNEGQCYEKGFQSGLKLDYRSERTIKKARQEVVTSGLLAFERWEKTKDFKYVLLHEYIRGLNHGLQKREEGIIERRRSKVK